MCQFPGFVPWGHGESFGFGFRHLRLSSRLVTLTDFINQKVVEISKNLVACDWPLLHLINPRYEVIFNVSVIFYTSEEDFIMPLSLKCFKSREDDISTFEDNVIYMVNTKGANILSAIACHWV